MAIGFLHPLSPGKFVIIEHSWSFFRLSLLDFRGPILHGFQKVMVVSSRLFSPFIGIRLNKLRETSWTRVTSPNHENTAFDFAFDFIIKNPRVSRDSLRPKYKAP